MQYNIIGASHQKRLHHRGLDEKEKQERRTGVNDKTQNYETISPLFVTPSDCVIVFLIHFVLLPHRLYDWSQIW